MGQKQGAGCLSFKAPISPVLPFPKVFSTLVEPSGHRDRRRTHASHVLPSISGAPHDIEQTARHPLGGNVCPVKDLALFPSADTGKDRR